MTWKSFRNMFRTATGIQKRRAEIEREMMACDAAREQFLNKVEGMGEASGYEYLDTWKSNHKNDAEGLRFVAEFEAELERRWLLAQANFSRARLGRK